MYKKKLLRGCLVATLAIAMAATSMSPVLSNGAAVVQAAEKTTTTVGVNYWDVENNIQAGEGKVVVEADANNVKTSALTDVPAGYEIVNAGDVAINGGWIYVEVRPAKTQTVGVNYFDEENNVQVFEGKVTVDAGANNVKTSALTDVPAGYEIVNTGDVAINDGWIYVPVRAVATTKEVGVNYYDVVNNKQVAESTVTVDADAYNVNTSVLKDVPAGYELARVGDCQINDGWIFVELRPVVEETQEYAYIEYVEANQGYTVAYGVAKLNEYGYFNTSSLQDVPDGYTLTTK